MRDRFGVTIKEVAPISSAGQDLYCFERTDSKLPMNVRDAVTVDCVPLTDKRSFSANYIGKRDFLPEFYSVLSNVRRAN